MKFPVFAYRDLKVGFNNIFCESNEQAAVRGFSYSINSASGIMGFAPEDFELFRIGIFDSDSGNFEPCLPEFIISGKDVGGNK